MAREQHIIVIGAMGVGKTTIGKLLATELDMMFFDSDEVLEIRTGETGADIAGREGVDRLHEIELELFLELCGQPTESVIAPASSVVDHEVGRSVLTEHVVVWLTAPDDVLAERQAAGDHRRPVGHDELVELRIRRGPHLKALSDIRVDTGQGTPDEVVNEIIVELAGD